MVSGQKSDGSGVDKGGNFMKTYQEEKIYVDDSSLEDEDWMMLRKIMRQITCCEVDEEEAQTIRREIIGMAKEARLRGRSLKEEIGESEQTFAEEIFRASIGREMAPGRRQLKGAGIFFVVYGSFYLLHFGLRFLVFGFMNMMGVYQKGEWSSAHQISLFWIFKETIVELAILALGIWTIRHCGDRRKRKKQKIAGICLLIYFTVVLVEILLLVSGVLYTIWGVYDMIQYFAGIAPAAGIIASGLYLSAVGRNRYDSDEEMEES